MRVPITLSAVGITATVSLTAFAQEPIDEVREMYPDQVAAIEADCPAPKELVTETWSPDSGVDRMSFYCWNQPTEASYRSGQWLGTLPVEADPSFAPPFTCAEADTLCQDLLPELQSQYPEELAAAELTCAAKNGRLFLQTQDQPEQTVDLRCGYFASSVYDLDGDGEVDYSDPISVDTSMFTAEL
mgnify:CR=1 FL=1